MKLDTLVDYPHTAEVWVVANQDDDAGDLVYAYDRVINCKFITNGRTSTVLAEGLLNPLDQLRNVKDVNGQPLNPGRTYAVKGINPVTNVFGFVEQMSYMITGGV